MQRPALLLLTALTICLTGLTSFAQAELKVGAAKELITPDPLLPISGGVGPGVPSTSKKGELTARSIVLQQGEETIAIVSLDLIGFPKVLGDRVRKQVTAIKPENIMIGSSHTHSAPDCYAFPMPDGGHTGDLKYMEFVCEQIVKSLNSALQNMQTAHLKVATGKGAERMAYNYYAPNLYDRRMSIMQAVTPEGKPIVTLVNYATHPEVLGTKPGITSPDCIGPMNDKIEKDQGGMSMFMNGAQGGMVTADNRPKGYDRFINKKQIEEARSWKECLRIGHLMADEAQRILKSASLQKDPKIFCQANMVRFPLESPLMQAILKASPLNYPYNEEDKSITAQINLVNIGHTQILTIPGEALPNIGFYLKRKMRGKDNILFGLTNDAFGYILTKVDYNSFDRYSYVTRTSLGEYTGEIMIDEMLKMVEEAPQPE